MLEIEKIARWIPAIALSLIVSSNVGAQIIGKVENMEGVPEIGRFGTEAWAPLPLGAEVSVGDQLRTRTHTKLALRLRDDSLLTLGENTVVTVDDHQLKPSAGVTAVFTLLLGRIRAVVSDRYKKPGSRFEVRTPIAVAGIRGTEFIATATADSSMFFGLESQTTVQPRPFIRCSRFTGCGTVSVK